MNAPRPPADDEALFEIEARLLLEAIYLRYQHDFRDYATASLYRRLREAMAAFGCTRLAELQHRILHDGDALARLMQYLTVQVSDLFRDPEYFLALRREVLPVLRTYPSLKVWVAGCSTGEEVWSLAILLREEGLLERTIVYATDIHPGSLRRAESGVFALDRIAQFSRNYLAAGGKGSLADYYSSAYDGALFDRSLKAQIVFADHSLATDSVFSEVHLVSCRNVLIYFKPALQDRAVGLFHEALVHRGFLGLGSHETLQFGAHAGRFQATAGAPRIYRRL
ncbi:MAG: protein-glutamate O-methyltransferase CheR [Lautropia sp.]